MKKIAYIITNNQKIKNNKEYIGVVDSIKKTTPDTPILYVGLENARKNIEDFSILNRNPKNNVFWTFGRREKRNEYEKDLINFNNYVIKNLSDKIVYHYINPLLLNRRKIYKLLNLLNENRFDKYFYVENGMIYCYFENKVIGFSTKILKYAYNIDEDRIIRLIKRNMNNHLFYFNNENIRALKKILPENNTYLISFFISLY